jgi:hypothetical protein
VAPYERDHDRDRVREAAGFFRAQGKSVDGLTDYGLVCTLDSWPPRFELD